MPGADLWSDILDRLFAEAKMCIRDRTYEDLIDRDE